MAASMPVTFLLRSKTNRLKANTNHVTTKLCSYKDSLTFHRFSIAKMQEIIKLVYENSIQKPHFCHKDFINISLSQEDCFNINIIKFMFLKSIICNCKSHFVFEIKQTFTSLKLVKLLYLGEHK